MATFPPGQPVRIRTGNYADLSGWVIDHTADSELLPQASTGFYWVRIVLYSFLVPVHVHGDDIEAITSDRLLIPLSADPIAL